MVFCPEKKQPKIQHKSTSDCNFKPPHQHGLLKQHCALLTPLAAYIEQQKDYATFSEIGCYNKTPNQVRLIQIWVAMNAFRKALCTQRQVSHSEKEVHSLKLSIDSLIFFFGS